MNKGKRCIIFIVLGISIFLLLGASEISTEQKEPEEKLEYFAIWDTEDIVYSYYEDSSGEAHYMNELPEEEKKKIEQRENVLIVDSLGREYDPDDFTEEEKEHIHNYWSRPYNPDNEIWDKGLQADIIREENNHWKLIDKEGNLIGEADGILDCRFDSDNNIHPVFKDAQTKLYGVLDEKFQILLPARFTSVYSVGGPYFFCAGDDANFIWNAETREMEWQIPEMPVKMAKTADRIGAIFYNGIIAAVRYSGADAYLFRFTETDPEKQAEYFYDIETIKYEYNKTYGLTKIIGLTGAENGRIYYIDTQGKELYSLPNTVAKPVTCINENRFIVGSQIVDKKGNPVLKADEPVYNHGIYIHVSMPDETLLGVYQRKNFNGLLYDILSVDGEVLIEGISEIYLYGDTCLYVKKGFYTGLMDYEGNWIWKRSAFQRFED